MYSPGPPGGRAPARFELRARRRDASLLPREPDPIRFVKTCRMNRLSAALAAACLLAAGCTTPRPTVRDYLSIVPDVVRHMEADARRNAPSRPVEGPLLLDVESFRGGGYWVTRQTVSGDSVQRVVPVRFTPAAGREAVLCEEGDMGGCWVREYGVFLRMNLMKHTADEMLAIATTYTTDRRAFPPQVCERVWRIRYGRDGGGWKVLSRELRRAECGGQPVEDAAAAEA